jgi:cytochrome c oxidase subunit 2
LFCAEYCGTDHSRMGGRVVVMEPADYQAWLVGTPGDESPAISGARLFTQFQCITCHGQRGPGLVGVYGSRREFTNAPPQIADENYLRESILNPSLKIVAGFQPLMPTYQGQLTEEQVMQLIAYIKSLNQDIGVKQPVGGAK